MRSLLLHLLLAFLVCVSFVVNATLDDPLPNMVPVYSELVSRIGPGSVGFVTGSSEEEAPYRYRAFRYALAPRVAAREGRRARREWVVSDQAGLLPGYTVVWRKGDDLLLLRRR